MTADSRVTLKVVKSGPNALQAKAAQIVEDYRAYHRKRELYLLLKLLERLAQGGQAGRTGSNAPKLKAVGA